MRITCVYGPQAEDETLRKFVFMMKWRVSGHDLESSSEIIASLGGFNGQAGECTEGFEGVRGGNGIREKMQKEEDCWSSVKK